MSPLAPSARAALGRVKPSFVTTRVRAVALVVPLVVAVLVALLVSGCGAFRGPSSVPRSVDEARVERAAVAVYRARNIAQREALPTPVEIAQRAERAWMLMEEREFGAAGDELHFLERALPGSFEVHYLQGRARLLGDGDADGARDSAERCIAVDASIGRCHELLGMARQDLGDREGALAAFASARALDPWLTGLEEREARLLLQLGRPDEALALARSALQTQRRNGALWMLVGAAAEQSGAIDDAEAAYLQAARVSVDPRGAWNALVRMYRSLGRHADADALVRAANSR